MLIYEGKEGEVYIRLFIQSKAKETCLVGEHGDRLKLKVSDPPVDGAANEAIMNFMAKLLGTSKSHISIKSGERSKFKLLKVTGIDIKNIQASILKGTKNT